MSGTTYSRTSGVGILPGTWQAVLSRHKDKALNSHERLSWDDASPDVQSDFVRLASASATRPPDFLRFDLARGPYPEGNYPGAVPIAQGMPADGALVGIPVAAAAAALNISEAKLQNELSKFSGPVTVSKLLKGQTIYRTVGLTAKSAKYGSITNKLLGDYWEPKCPSSYPTLEDWRQGTAVLAEWNGDYGYLAVTLDEEVVALSGMAAMQVVDVPRQLVLPGGAQQYFIPDLASQSPSLVQWVQSNALEKLISETQFSAAKP